MRENSSRYSSTTRTAYRRGYQLETRLVRASRVECQAANRLLKLDIFIYSPYGPEIFDFFPPSERCRADRPGSKSQRQKILIYTHQEIAAGVKRHGSNEPVAEEEVAS